MASNLLHVSHFNVDDPKGNRCGTIQTKHHHHSHLIQNSMKLDICCSSILSCLGESIKAFCFSHTGFPPTSAPHDVVSYHTCSAKGIEACILTPPCQLLRSEIFVVRMGSFFTELKVVLPQMLFQSSNAHAYIYTIQYTTLHNNTMHYTTIQCDALQTYIAFIILHTKYMIY